MRKTILKISSLLLCGLLIYNSLGYFLVLSFMRVAVRQQKWAHLYSIPDNELSTFNFPKNTVSSRLKIVNNREIRVDGKLYDVVRKSESDKAITYHCVHDEKEESLIAKTRLFNSQALQMPLQNMAKIFIDKIIKTAVIADITKRFLFYHCQSYSFYIQKEYSGPFRHILLPPPKTYCFVS